MKTVLGLSVTVAGVGWVLVDGSGPGQDPLDDDKFTVRDADDLLPRCVAAVRGADAIAASTGRRISSIGVCWSEDVEDQIGALLSELRAAGYVDVRAVRQVIPIPVDVPAETDPQRCGRVDPRGLLAEIFAAESEFDDGDRAADAVADARDRIGGPSAGRTCAYAAGQAVVTNAVPPEPTAVARPRRMWTPPKLAVPDWRHRVPAVPDWRPPVPSGRVATAAAAVAVTALVALFAVGSQFTGNTGQQSAEAAPAAAPAAQTTTQVVHAAPPPVRPIAASEPAPVRPEANRPPVQLAIPQPRPVVRQPPATVAPPVSAAPLAAPQVPADVVPAVPAPPVAEAVPAGPPAAAPLPVDQAAPIAPPEVLPPAVAPPPPPPPPFWLAPPFVPPPPAAPAPAPAPVELPPPPPALGPPPGPPPVNPVFGALP